MANASVPVLGGSARQLHGDARQIGHACHRHAESETGVEQRSLLEQADRVGIAFRSHRVDVRHGLQIEVVGVETVGRLAAGTLDFGARHTRLDDSDHVLRYSILYVEYVLQ